MSSANRREFLRSAVLVGSAVELGVHNGIAFAQGEQSAPVRLHTTQQVPLATHCASLPNP